MVNIILVKFVLVLLFSLLFGLERQRSHKPIGFGTFIFVAVGSCALAITSLELGGDNPLALIGAIVTGIGFLGAGALIRTSDKIFGFTTAASIWVFAIFGLSIGLGEYFVGFILYAFVWVVIGVDKMLEFKSIGSYQKKLTIAMTKNMHIAEIAKMLHITHYKIINIDIDKNLKKSKIVVLIEGRINDINAIPSVLESKPWVESFAVE
jgi:putative Mg2+ transporter-C (MgtC) family protein